MSSDIGITLKQKALQKHFEKLADAITDPDRFASKLYSKGFITRGKREAITSTMGISRYSKALQLLDVVEARVRSDPNAFKKFVRILKSVHGMQVIGDAVLGSYCEFRVIRFGTFPVNVTAKCMASYGYTLFVCYCRQASGSSRNRGFSISARKRF